jgi:cytochrome c peroxidase
MNRRRLSGLVTVLALIGGGAAAWGQAGKKPPPSSYAPVVAQEPLSAVVARMKAQKPAIAKRHAALLAERYDLANRPSRAAKMFRGKPVQTGVRARLAKGQTWDHLAAMAPDEVRAKALFPAAFLPLPHPNHGEGGMLFPEVHIREVKRQEARDLTRFDLDFDLPEHLLPEFPPPIFLTTRPDLGDVSRGKLVTLVNFFALFDGLLNPKRSST